YTPVDCRATVRIPHRFNQSAIALSSAVVQPKHCTDWRSRLGGTAPEWKSLPVSKTGGTGGTTPQTRTLPPTFPLTSPPCRALLFPPLPRFGVPTAFFPPLFSFFAFLD